MGLIILTLLGLKYFDRVGQISVAFPQPEYLRQNSSNSPNTKKEEEGVIYSSSMNNRNKQEESKGYIVKSRLR